MSSEKKVVVVIAGAGARGAYEAGALATLLPVLVERGEIESLVLLGTSAGAINATLWASRARPGSDVAQVGEQVKAVWLGITQERVFRDLLSTATRRGLQFGAGFVNAQLSSWLRGKLQSAAHVSSRFGSLGAGVARKAIDTASKLAPEPLHDVALRPLGELAERARTMALPWLGIVHEISGLLDTSPLFATAREVLQLAALHENVRQAEPALGPRPFVDGVGVVATSCPIDGSGGRSRVFLYAPSLEVPKADPDGALDYVPVDLTSEHVLASAAIPIAFPPVLVEQPEEHAGWYTDGGVRLNTPIEPAVKLGATHLIIVSSHATRYPPPRALGRERPDVLDLGAQSIHAVLADGMIEDLRTLRNINRLVEKAEADGVEPPRSASGRPYRSIQLLDVAPSNQGLSHLATETLAELGPWERAQYGLMRLLLTGAGTGAGNNELLSYLLFHPTYFRKQFERGAADARLALERGFQTTTQVSESERSRDDRRDGAAAED